VCTNVACMLQGAYELLDHIEERLGVAPGGTTTDGLFTLEDAECLALCGNAPCLTVNWRFFGDVDPPRFNDLVDDLTAGRLVEEVPPHGTLSRVRRTIGLTAVGQSVNGAGGPPGAADRPVAPATGPVDGGVRLDTRLTTTAVDALDGGRPRQLLTSTSRRGPAAGKPPATSTPPEETGSAT
jgi:(2Fe-2S) ferredoxin